MLLRKLHTLVAAGFVFWTFTSTLQLALAMINLHHFNIEERRDYSESWLLGAKQCGFSLSDGSAKQYLDPLIPKSKKNDMM